MLLDHVSNITRVEGVGGFCLVSTSPCRSGELAGSDSCVGFVVELAVLPGRLDEFLPAAQQDYHYIG